MWALIKLYLPVLFPSWRFFGEIGASPRVEFRVGRGPWQAASDRPAKLTLRSSVTRLFWNPDWNESLFMIAQSERLLLEDDPAIAIEIARRVALRHGLIAPPEIRIRVVTGAGCASIAYPVPADAA